MQLLFSKARLVEHMADGIPTTLGNLVPADVYLVPGPVGFRVEDDRGLISVEAYADDGQRRELAPPRLHAWLGNHRSRTALPEADAIPALSDEQVTRRLRALEIANGHELPKDSTSKMARMVGCEHWDLLTDSGADQYLDANAHALAALGFGSVPEGAAAIVRGALAKRGIEMTGEVVCASLEAAFALGSYGTFGVRGIELDRIAEAEEAARALEAERIAAQKAASERMNAQTLSDLGIVAVSVRLKSTPNVFGQNLSSPDLGALEPVARFAFHSYDVGDHRILLLNPPFGARVNPGKITAHISVLPDDFVPAVRAVELSTAIARSHRKTQALDNAYVTWFFNEFRPQTGVEVTTSPTPEGHGRWDYSTTEGRHRIDLAKRLLTHAALPGGDDDFYITVIGGSFGASAHAVFQALHEGLGLAEDVARTLMHERADARREESDTWPKHFQSETKKPLPTRWSSPEAILQAYVKTSKHFPTPWFAPDELYAPPAPGMIDRIAMTLASDPWANDVELAAEKLSGAQRAPVRSAALESALGLSSPTTLQQRRVHKIMTRAGWKKTMVEIDGARVKAFVRTNVASALVNTVVDAAKSIAGAQ